jgi:hypothetical protein
VADAFESEEWNQRIERDDPPTLTLSHPLPPVILTGFRGEVTTFEDAYVGADNYSVPPIQKAVWVARLRALADQIEAS